MSAECGEIMDDVQSMAEHLERHSREGINKMTRDWMCYWNDCRRGRRSLCKRSVLSVHFQQHTGETKFQVREV